MSWSRPIWAVMPAPPARSGGHPKGLPGPVLSMSIMVPPYLGALVEVGVAAAVEDAPGAVAAGVVAAGLLAAGVVLPGAVAPGVVAAGAEVVAGVVEGLELQPVTIKTAISRTRNGTISFFNQLPPI
jgi:hypothetical protein